MDYPVVHPFQDEVLQMHGNNTRNVEGTAADGTFGVNTHKVGQNFHCPSNFFFLIYMSSLSYELKWDIIIFNNKGEIFILYLFFLFGCVYIIVVADNTGPLFKERHVQTI